MLRETRRRSKPPTPPARGIERSDRSATRAPRRLPSLLLFLAALLPCPTNLIAQAPPASIPPGDWLTVADTVEPASLDCLKTSERSARQICRLVADSLIDFDQRLRFVPRLAESFSLSADHLTLTFKLRDGVLWHDGARFTAADVLYTVDQLRRADPSRELYRVNFGPMASVQAPDDRTILATYAEPFAGALTGWRELLILPAKHPYDPTAPSALDRAPVGTGPFRFLRWDPQQQIVLTANRDYFGPPPRVDRYVHRFLPGIDAMKAAALSGEVDVAPLSSDWLRTHGRNDAGLPFRVVVSPTSLMEMIYWNVDEPRGLFRDPRVRRAMTLLLDREGYVTRVHQGIYRTAATLIDPALWGGSPSVAPLPCDSKEAARLLDEAGFVDRDGDGVRDTPSGPFAFQLLYTGSSSEQREIASIFERAAAAAGVRVELSPLEWAVLRPRAYARQFQALIFRWRLEPLPDPYAYFHSTQAAPDLKNLGGWKSEEFDRLADRHRATIDPEAGAPLLESMQRVLDRDQPVTVVAVAGAVMAIHRRFRTPEMTSAGYWNWYPGLLDWWVPPELRKHR